MEATTVSLIITGIVSVVTSSIALLSAHRKANTDYVKDIESRLNTLETRVRVCETERAVLEVSLQKANGEIFKLMQQLFNREENKKHEN